MKFYICNPAKPESIHGLKEFITRTWLKQLEDSQRLFSSVPVLGTVVRQFSRYNTARASSTTGTQDNKPRDKKSDSPKPG